MSRDRERIERLVTTAREVPAAGLVVATSGNVSVRLDGGRFAVSASGARLAELTPEQVSVCGMNEEAVFEGPRPSMETPLHRAVYRTRADVEAILHFQALHATVLACAEEEPRFDLDFIPEVSAYIRRIAVVPYFDPGTPELAAAVAEEASDRECNLLVLRSHGQIAIGPDLGAVLRNSAVFEFACRMVCQGIPLKRFDRKTVEALRRYGRP